jgi:NAD-dependent SIR2 family protein deacetylase
MSLATPEAFAADPGLVWRFYSYRRHMALSVNPNPAHYALAELARTLPGFMTLSQNVDGLSPRADHPRDQLKLLHGSLFEVKCSNRRCGYVEENYTDPIVPALDLPAGDKDLTSNEYLKKEGKLDISDPTVKISEIDRKDLPTCPQCQKALLRPGVVWFGEALPSRVIDEVEAYLDEADPVDLIIVIGTGAKVYPAAGYIQQARQKKARVCVVNMGERRCATEETQKIELTM